MKKKDKFYTEVRQWLEEKKKNPPLSVMQINLIKDSYLKHIQEKDGCLIVSNKWEFIMSEGKVKDALLEVKGLDSDGKSMSFFVGVNTIINWNKNK